MGFLRISPWNYHIVNDNNNDENDDNNNNLEFL